jgi:membrane-associated phospholipid phosphatase
MKKLMEIIKSVPRWGIITGIVYFVLQYAMYRFGDFLSHVIGTFAYAFPPKIPFLDDHIPLVPVFVIIYIYSYVFWIMGPMAVSLTKKRNFVNYIAGLSLAYVIGFLFFVFMPTYMDRAQEGLMEIASKPGIFNQLLGVVYGVDGSTLGFNLFPSYHCLISTYCYLGVRKQEEISKGFRIYSLIMAILISFSTVLTKQHYVLDIFGGVGIAIFCYWLMNRIDPGKKYEEKELKQR